jgi:hypothetical protein
MIGYHFTSHRNWLSIQKTGLKTYPINKPEIDQHSDEQIWGIWTWIERPVGKSELGSILFQTSTKQSTNIVLLEFNYEDTDILRLQGKRVRLFHDGFLGDWLYHKSQQAWIVTRDVLPSEVRLIKEFNLLELVK